MAKKKWYAGKTVNPEFQTVTRAHALECNFCGSPEYGSAKAHQAWRNRAEGHLGKALPPTFLAKAPTANQNISKAQGAWWLDLRKDD